MSNKKENVQDVQEPKKRKNEVTFWKVLAYVFGGILALIGGLFADQKWNNGSITKSIGRGLKSVVAWVCNLFTPAKKKTQTVVQDGQGQQAPKNNNFEQRRVERPNHGQGNGYYYNNKKPVQPEEKK